MNKTKCYKFLVANTIVELFVPIIITGSAEARPGGGSSFRSSGSSSYSSHSYSGGSYSSHSYSGSSGGNADDLGVFIALFIIGILWVLISIRRTHGQKGNMIISQKTASSRENSAASVDLAIESLKNRDSSFSKVLFLDFVNSLYNKFYDYQGKPEIVYLKPFIEEGLFKNIAKLKNLEINEIVVGSLNISSISEQNENDIIVLDIEANYTINNRSNSSRYIVMERWKMSRGKTVQSPSPEIMRGLNCPNCGGTANFTDSGECNYCHTQINIGQMQWFLAQRVEINKEFFSADSAGNFVEEEGTDNPTIKQFSLKNQEEKFLTLHKINDWESYWKNFQKNIASVYFKEIYSAWSGNKLQNVRYILSDRLYDSFGFWIRTYQEKSLVNKLEQLTIEKIELARIDLDKFYESITVRIFASGFDYIEDNNGKVITGSKSKKRRFSEYWTFIRRAGIETTEQITNLKNCPNCGATSDKIGQAGECVYCGSKITTGDFSWVLTIITQDEVYRG